MTTRQDIFAYVRRKYGTVPEYLWASAPNYAVLRHDDNRKWYAIIMDVPRKKMGLDGDGSVDVMNVKCDDVLMGMLLGTPGYRPAYHMNKANWISVILDDSVSRDEIFNLIQQSYNATASRIKK